ncbi:MAG: cell wall metabolism sensor histidine kinase WalK, partial [Planctomycetales bacterium]
MENHRNRPELVQAASGLMGISQRVSPTLNISMLYLATPVTSGERITGFIRVALPMDSVLDQINASRRLAWATAVGVIGVALVLTYGFVSNIIRPIRALTQAAEAIAQGDYSVRFFAPRRDEFGKLAAAFQRMNVELSRTLAKINSQQQELAAILGSMVEGVLAMDQDQRVRFVNQAAREMLAIDSPAVEGRPLGEVVRLPSVEEAVQDAQRGTPIPRRELEVRSASQRVLALRVTELSRDPRPGLALVFHDVTELRRLEQLRREFVANVSHELKTPLTSIRAYAETLRAGAIHDDEHNVRFVERIEEQAGRLARLIHDLLSLARIESEEQVFDLKATPVSDRLAEWTSLHAPAADAKGIELETHLPDEPVFAVADEEGLRQIVDNLLDNAVKYTPRGGRVSVRLSKENGQAVIEVEDNGLGLEPADQARVFERFFRVDKARSRELGGTGLGLSIVKHLAGAFGGDARVSSQPGKGSVFTVRLPLASADSEAG